MNKIGRNSPCPCGSGKKYKRCHCSVEKMDRLSAEMLNMQRRAEATLVQRERQQGFGKPIISAATASGYRLVAVKNRLLHSKGWKTFHDFLGDYIKMAIGPEWGNAELAKPSSERHPILNWYQSTCAQQRIFITERGKVASAKMTGSVAAYLHLAYDLYALDHNAELQSKLLARLRNYDNFEGARYEVFVAAKLIRAGFEIEFENEDDRSSSHCEFTATFTRTGKKFSVEAKHRASLGAKLRLGHFLVSALQKQATHPRIAFIDINIPDDGSDAKDSWMKSSIHRLRAFEGKSINGQPLPSAYVFVTNTPWHHHLTTTAFRCGMAVEGFQISDFKGDIPAVSLRAAIEARERHIEMHELIRSVQDHNDIPATFDGEIPEFAFGDGIPRLLIGQRYLVRDDEGAEQPGVLTTATVSEEKHQAFCGLTLENGKAVICTWPLSDLEMAAWRKHPDTFFGEVGQRKHTVNDPLEMYDFFLNSYHRTPRQRLLELLAGAPDIQELSKLDQASLASIYAERSALAAWTMKSQASQIPPTRLA